MLHSTLAASPDQHRSGPRIDVPYRIHPSIHPVPSPVRSIRTSEGQRGKHGERFEWAIVQIADCDLRSSSSSSPSLSISVGKDLLANIRPLDRKYNDARRPAAYMRNRRQQRDMPSLELVQLPVVQTRAVLTRRTVVIVYSRVEHTAFFPPVPSRPSGDFLQPVFTPWQRQRRTSVAPPSDAGRNSTGGVVYECAWALLVPADDGRRRAEWMDHRRTAVCLGGEGVYL